MGIRICPDCGGKVSTSRENCIHCGYVFPTVICPDCASEVDKKLLECPICGYMFPTKEYLDVDNKLDKALYTIKDENHIYFGSYPQGRYGEEMPIEWRILDKKDGRALILSEYGSGVYAKSWVRKWLDEFYIKAFNEKEKSIIQLITINNSAKPWRQPQVYKDPIDKIFLLSDLEAIKYNLVDVYDKKPEYTMYVDKERFEYCYSWWLRSRPYDCPDIHLVCYPNPSPSNVPVRNDRLVPYLHQSNIDSAYGVRPACWINL